MLPEQFVKFVEMLVLEYICKGICMNFLIHLLIQKVNRIMYVQLNEKGQMIENFCLIFIVHATCY